jgi:ribonuclease HI
MGLIVYTDGGCSGNPGPGGWAYVIVRGDRKIKGSGARGNTTNNQMELTAVIEALGRIAAEAELAADQVEVFTDSQYVKNGITQWILRWEKNGWKTAGKKPVKNRELWQRLRGLQQRLSVSWSWVTAHRGIELNELVDSMVQQEIARLVAAG